MFRKLFASRDGRLLVVLLTGLLCAGTAHAQLAAGPGLPRGDAKAAGLSPDKLAALDAILKTAVEQKKIAGGSALVARNGKLVHLAAAGVQDIETGVPVSDRTIFRIASMTKPITSVAAMMLVEESTVFLDVQVAT